MTKYLIKNKDEANIYSLKLFDSVCEAEKTIVNNGGSLSQYNILSIEVPESKFMLSKLNNGDSFRFKQNHNNFTIFASTPCKLMIRGDGYFLCTYANGIIPFTTGDREVIKL